nr:alanine racemase [Pelomonas sp. P8]
MTIDLDALADNWRTLSRLCAPARCAAVVKADAYGLGATPVVRCLLNAGCREFFVSLLDEGVRLRESVADAWPRGAHLYVLHGTPGGAESDCLAYGFVPVLNTKGQVERWQALARRQGRPQPAALQVDTAMTRLGLPPSTLTRMLEAREGLSGVTTTLVMSQLINAHKPQHPANRRQLELFRRWRQRFPSAKGSLADSSGIFLGHDFHFDVVRAGTALYGVAPAAGMPTPMRQVVQVKARLLQCREVSTGEGTGDQGPWRATRPTRLATLSLGPVGDYLGGEPQGRLRVAGRALPLVSRPSQHTAVVDATEMDAAHLAIGALLDLVDEVQDINAFAEATQTTAFDVLTSLGSHYRRQYQGKLPL